MKPDFSPIPLPDPSDAVCRPCNTPCTFVMGSWVLVFQGGRTVHIHNTPIYTCPLCKSRLGAFIPFSNQLYQLLAIPSIKSAFQAPEYRTWMTDFSN